MMSNPEILYTRLGFLLGDIEGAFHEFDGVELRQAQAQYLLQRVRKVEREIQTRYRQALLDQHVTEQLAVRDAMLSFMAAIQPDEQYDPADDPRTDEPARKLVDLLGESRANGVMEVLRSIETRALLAGIERGAGMQVRPGDIFRLDLRSQFAPGITEPLALRVDTIAADEMSATIGTRQEFGMDDDVKN
jgi:hypothetical protein